MLYAILLQFQPGHALGEWEQGVLLLLHAFGGGRREQEQLQKLLSLSATITNPLKPRTAGITTLFGTFCEMETVTGASFGNSLLLPGGGQVSCAWAFLSTCLTYTTYLGGAHMAWKYTRSSLPPLPVPPSSPPQEILWGELQFLCGCILKRYFLPAHLWSGNPSSATHSTFLHPSLHGGAWKNPLPAAGALSTRLWATWPGGTGLREDRGRAGHREAWWRWGVI